MKKLVFRECPSDESFVLHFSGELVEGDEAKLLEHASRCSKCRLRLSALGSLQAELDARKKDLPEVGLTSQDEVEFRKMAREQARACAARGGSLYFKFVRLGGIVAAGVVLVFLVYGQLVKTSPPEPVIRGRGQVQLRLYRPEGNLSQAPIIFSWSKVPDADIYHLEIVDDDLNQVFITDLPGTRFSLPENVRQTLKSQKPYLWTVSAFDDDARELQSASGYFEIE